MTSANCEPSEEHAFDGLDRIPTTYIFIYIYNCSVEYFENNMAGIGTNCCLRQWLFPVKLISKCSHDPYDDALDMLET